MSKLVSVLIFLLCLPSISFSEKNDSVSENKFDVLFPVKMRDQPSWDGGAIEPLSPGNKLIVLSKEGNWYKVQTESGKIGYVAMNWVVNTIQAAKQREFEDNKYAALEAQRERAHFFDKIVTELSSFVGSITLVSIGCLALFALLMPVFVWQIKRQTIKMNKQLENILEVMKQNKSITIKKDTLI